MYTLLKELAKYTFKKELQAGFDYDFWLHTFPHS